jgi:hypothetical protein
MAKISTGFRTALVAFGGVTATVMAFIYASTIYCTIFGVLDTWDVIISWPAIMWLPHAPYLFPDKSCFPCCPPISIYVASSIAGNLVIFVTGAWLTGIMLKLFKVHAPIGDPPRHSLLRWTLYISAGLGLLGALGVCFAAKYYPYTDRFDNLACVFGQIHGISSMLFVLICLAWAMCFVGAAVRSHLFNKPK